MTPLKAFRNGWGCLPHLYPKVPSFSKKEKQCGPRSEPDVLKLFHESAEHEISNAHRYENIKKYSILSGSDKLRMLFFLHLNV